MQIDSSISTLISLLDTNVKEQAKLHLVALPFNELSSTSKKLLFDSLLERSCFEPLYNLSLCYYPISIDDLMQKCLNSNDACKVLMNLSRKFEVIAKQTSEHKDLAALITTDFEYMYAIVVNISKYPKIHPLLLENIPNFSNNKFTHAILKNLAFNADNQSRLVDILPQYLPSIVAPGFHASIVMDDRALAEFEKDTITDFIFTLKDTAVEEPPLDFLQFLLILLNGEKPIRDRLSQLGLYYILRHLDLYATEKKWENLNLAIIDCVELLLATDH